VPTGVGQPWRDMLTAALHLDVSQRPRSVEEWWQTYAGALTTPMSASPAQTVAQSAAPPLAQPTPSELKPTKAVPLPAQPEGFWNRVAQVFAPPATPNPPTLPSSPQVLTLSLSKGKTLELVKIPAGSFMMGSNEYEDKKPPHRVTLQEYWMGKYPVTQGQYEAVMGKNPSYFKGANHPVERVSWGDAVAFCQKLSEMTGQRVSLPSEAQWEYACRAGSTGQYCFGDDESKLGEYAWFNRNSDGKTHPVGQKKANAWGLYDMHGNVWEWCADIWHENYKGAPEDGSAWVEGGKSFLRVLRGGSWYFSPRDCRSANRDWFFPEYGFDFNGFRLVFVSS
jgi:eukaryotic-like serine/threonine-protein kinase